MKEEADFFSSAFTGEGFPGKPDRWLRGVGLGALVWDRSPGGVRGVYGRHHQPGPRLAPLAPFVAIVRRAVAGAKTRPVMPDLGVSAGLAADGGR